MPAKKDEKKILDGDEELEALLVKTRESIRNANVGRVHEAVLKNGPRAFRVASVFEILDPSTGGVHHHVLRITNFRKANDGWYFKEKRWVDLVDKEGEDEIGRLTALLGGIRAARLPEAAGDFVFIDAARATSLGEIEAAIEGQDDPTRVEWVARLLNQLPSGAMGSEDFAHAVGELNPAVARDLGAAVKVVEYRKELVKLQNLIAEDAVEARFQELLEANPWMFGSEYSRLLDQRVWSRDDQQDFMFRRTVDGYLEVVEIKRARPHGLFNFDSGRQVYYPKAELSAVLGQVMHYLEQLDGDRDRIRARDGEDPHKVRARIVVGLNGDGDGEGEALRTLNAHMNRIEVITFDQLEAVASRVIEAVAGSTGGD